MTDKTLDERKSQLPKAKVKTLSLASPLTERIFKNPFNPELFLKYNLHFGLFHKIKMKQYSLCLNCQHYFFSVEPAGFTVMDNRKFFCTSHCRRDWNTTRILQEELIAKMQNRLGHVHG